MSVSVTLTFGSIPEMLNALGGINAAPAVIRHEDRPDVGAPLPPVPAPVAATPIAPPPPPTLNTAAIFGGTAAALEAAAVPVVPPPAPALSPSGKPVDKRGLPWDNRIHATNSEKTGGVITEEGIWRKKRGLNDPALVARVEAELMQAMSAPAAATVASPLPGTAAPAVVPAVPQPPVVTPPAAPVAALPTPPAPPAVAAAPGADTFPGFMAYLAPKLAASPAAADRLTQALAAAGLTAGVGQLAQRPDLVPSVRSTFDALQAAAGAA